MDINFTNDKPIYLQIVDQIKRDILRGRYQQNEKLPSVREMALQMQVNPNTMQRAYSTLEAEGLVEAKRTSGRFVCVDAGSIEKMKQEMALEELDNFLESMKEIGVSREDVKELLKKVDL